MSHPPQDDGRDERPEEQATPPERRTPSSELEPGEQPTAPDDSDPDHVAIGLGVDIPPYAIDDPPPHS